MHCTPAGQVFQPRATRPRNKHDRVYALPQVQLVADAHVGRDGSWDRKYPFVELYGRAIILPTRFCPPSENFHQHCVVHFNRVFDCPDERTTSNRSGLKSGRSAIEKHRCFDVRTSKAKFKMQTAKMRRSREIMPDERVTGVKPSTIFARQAFANLVQLPQNLTANRAVRASSL